MHFYPTVQPHIPPPPFASNTLPLFTTHVKDRQEERCNRFMHTHFLFVHTIPPSSSSPSFPSLSLFPTVLVRHAKDLGKEWDGKGGDGRRRGRKKHKEHQEKGKGRIAMGNKMLGCVCEKATRIVLRAFFFKRTMYVHYLGECL